MNKGFPKTGKDTRDLAMQLVKFLRTHIEDTRGRDEWTKQSLDALRAFCKDATLHPYTLKSFPPEGSYLKGAFLWDYVAYQQNTGILITAESEWDEHRNKLEEDFDKLLYAQSRIKLFMFRTERDDSAIDEIVAHLTHHMKSCTEYSPSEVYILYCRRWKDVAGKRGDLAWLRQIAGDPAYRNVSGTGFVKIP